MRIIIYARVSTSDQADGVSLEAQRAKLVAYADALDLEVVETIEDAGESGKSLNRPGLQHALRMLSGGEADGIAIVKLDRLTRSVSDWQTLINGWFGEKPGKQLFSLGDSINTATAGGRLVLNVLLSVAQWERETIGERTREALRHKISKGERCGKVRYGYDLGEDGKTLIPNATEQEAISTIGRLRAAGRSLRAIAAELTSQGVSTKEGRPWTHTAVSRILQRA